MKTDKPTVLIADDDADMIRVMTKRLTHAGFDVITASNGRDAIAVFAIQPPDVALLDVQMPDLDGFSVCEHIRRKTAWENIPVFFLTGAEDGIIRKHLPTLTSHVGGNRYFTKPFDGNVLVSLLHSAVAPGFFLPSQR